MRCINKLYLYYTLMQNYIDECDFYYALSWMKIVEY